MFSSIPTPTHGFWKSHHFVVHGYLHVECWFGELWVIVFSCSQFWWFHFPVGLCACGWTHSQVVGKLPCGTLIVLTCWYLGILHNLSLLLDACQTQLFICPSQIYRHCLFTSMRIGFVDFAVNMVKQTIENVRLWHECHPLIGKQIFTFYIEKSSVGIE